MKKLRSSTKYRGTQCLNCEHPLDKSDKYCPSCGQLNSTKKLSFSDFFNEFFAGVFAYDSRLRRTITALLVYPGRISRDYIRGKRMRYANPFRFYLSASIIFFLVWNLTNEIEGFNGMEDNRREIEDLTPEERQELRESLGRIPALEDSPIAIDSLLANPRSRTTSTYLDNYKSQNELDSLGVVNSFSRQLELYDEFYQETGILQPQRALDSLRHDTGTYNRWMYKKVTDWNVAKTNPQIFWNYFYNKLPFIIFFYLPVFALFIWLLYVRRPFNYMEHLIFTFHVQTTFFVILSIAIVVDYIFSTDFFSGLTMFLFLFYLYKAMRKFYGQGRFKTLVKFILLNGIFLILAVVATIISLLASFAIY